MSKKNFDAPVSVSVPGLTASHDSEWFALNGPARQVPGSGLVAPCGMLFNEKYKKFHIGNICEQSFKEIWQSERYWEVMNYLASPEFNAQKMCGSLCLQHKVNEALDNLVKGNLELEHPAGKEPQHLAFV